MVLAKEPRQEPLSLSLSVTGQKLRFVISVQPEANSRKPQESITLLDTLCDPEVFLLSTVPDTGWETDCITPLEAAVRAGRRGRGEQEELAFPFLERILSGENPLAAYCAMRVWDAYLSACTQRDMDSAARLFRSRAERLTSCFLEGTEPACDAVLQLSYAPDRTEWVQAGDDPALLLTWCSARLAAQGRELRTCGACGRRFLSSGPRNLLCSETCRKLRARENKQAYDNRARESGYEILYKNACQHWRNRIRRAEKADAADIESASAAFAEFKREALSRKRRVKAGTEPQEVFSEWISEQTAMLDTLLP